MTRVAPEDKYQPEGAAPSGALRPRRNSSAGLATLGDALKMTSEKKKINGLAWYLLHPDSTRIFAWDIVVTLALVYTATITPAEVAFAEPHDDPSSCATAPLYVINRLIDCLFVLDMAKEFVLVYRTSTSTGVVVDSRWETRPSRIARRYVCGQWFVVDVLSIVPSFFELDCASEESQAADPATGGISAMRVVRILRLGKLVRLLRASRILKRAQTRIALDYATISLWTLSFSILVLTHWVACLLGLIPGTFWPRLQSWQATHGYCEPAGVELAGVGSEDGGGSVGAGAGGAGAGGAGAGGAGEEADEEARCVSPAIIYLTCFQWALGFIVGFTAEPEGGPFEPHFSAHSPVPGLAFQVHERVCNLVLVVLGAFFWAYVTGRIVEIIANGDPDGAAFHQTMDNLNRFVRFYRLPREQARSLREYYHETRRVVAATARQAVCEGLSHDLQLQVALGINQGWMYKVPFFERLAPGPNEPPDAREFLARVAVKMQSTVFPPGERPPTGRLYVIFAGAASYKGRTLGQGHTWGELDVMLSKAPKCYRATAVQYLHVMCIDRETLRDIAHDYPLSLKVIKKWAFFHGIVDFLLEWNRKRKVEEAQERARQAERSKEGLWCRCRRLNRASAMSRKLKRAHEAMAPADQLATLVAELQADFAAVGDKFARAQQLIGAGGASTARTASPTPHSLHASAHHSARIASPTPHSRSSSPMAPRPPPVSAAAGAEDPSGNTGGNSGGNSGGGSNGGSSGGSCGGSNGGSARPDGAAAPAPATPGAALAPGVARAAAAQDGNGAQDATASEPQRRWSRSRRLLLPPARPAPAIRSRLADAPDPAADPPKSLDAEPDATASAAPIGAPIGVSEGEVPGEVPQSHGRDAGFKWEED